MAATNQQILDAVNDAILARVTGSAVKSYSIAGRSLTSYNISELKELKKFLEDEISRANSRTTPRRAYAGFSRIQ